MRNLRSSYVHVCEQCHEPADSYLQTTAVEAQQDQIAAMAMSASGDARVTLPDTTNTGFYLQELACTRGFPKSLGLLDEHRMGASGGHMYLGRSASAHVCSRSQPQSLQHNRVQWEPRADQDSDEDAGKIDDDGDDDNDKV